MPTSHQHLLNTKANAENAKLGPFSDQTKKFDINFFLQTSQYIFNAKDQKG
jgi:hypothetical protein